MAKNRWIVERYYDEFDSEPYVAEYYDSEEDALRNSKTNIFTGEVVRVVKVE